MKKDVAAWTFECDSKLTFLLLWNENHCSCMKEDHSIFYKPFTQTCFVHTVYNVCVG